MSYPQNLLYTADHEWVLIENNIATVGITSYATSQLGDIVYLDVTGMGKDLGAGEAFGTVEAVKTVADLYMPVAGRVIEVNDALNANPEIINQDPYGAGWLVKVDVGGAPDLSGLKSPSEYEAHAV